jgi:hypothetical protein
MPPSSHDRQPSSDLQGLSVLTEPIDEASIIPAEAVEKLHTDGALEAYQASSLDVPVAPDYSTISITRTKSSDSEDQAQ